MKIILAGSNESDRDFSTGGSVAQIPLSFLFRDSFVRGVSGHFSQEYMARSLAENRAMNCEPNAIQVNCRRRVFHCIGPIRTFPCGRDMSTHRMRECACSCADCTLYVSPIGEKLGRP